MLRRFFARRTATVSGGLLLIAALLAGAASASAAPGQPAVHLHKVIVFLRNGSAGHPGKVRAEVAPLARALRAHGAKHVSAGTTLPFVAASVTPAQKKALSANPAVQAVLPDVAIPAPTSELNLANAPAAPLTGAASKAAGPCGTATAPEQDPEALAVVKAPAALNAGFDGAGVKTAYIAGTIDTTIPDFQRNAKYASAGSPAGSPVVTAVDFTGDPAGTPDPSDGSVESFGDAGSIAAQGNTVFDLSQFVNASHPLPAHCNITITGTAPGATVLGENVFSNLHVTTTSNFIQAIQYAVANGVQVLNQSFGGNPFPDAALDAVRIADDQAVAAGVTVVVSSGDAGVTSTIGSPATDPKVISVGASTTFRAYQQLTFGGINATSPNATNGKWINNNISSLSSGGFSQGGRTVDLVAPGDLGWSECSSNNAIYQLCTDENNQPSGMQLFGGTSQSAPLTAGAAADVIQAYQQTHGGQAPSPALVKQILTSSATDISAPAEQQGAGLLNIGAAVKLAQSIKVKHRKGGLLLSPNQIDITRNTGAAASKKIRVTNEGSKKETVHLATRTLSKKIASHSGSFCLNPRAFLISCGPPTANSFQIWSGFTEVYQEETFKVPHTKSPSRLNFSATYPYTGQTSVLHVALYAPGGAYAGYSAPQGLANYANVQVANPKAGTWTAVFFTVKNTSTELGTQGRINWQADTWTFGKGGSIKPSSLTLKPGQTRSATFKVKSPKTAGDRAESILVRSKSGKHTIPVVIRTLVKSGTNGGTFKGVLTGGNGRDLNAVTHTVAFNVPSGKRDLEVSVKFGNPDDDLIAFLQDPAGNTVASSSNITLNSAGSCCIAAGALDVYKDNPEAGRWTVVLDWLPPVTSDSFAQLSMPFTGKIEYNQVKATSSDLPNGATLNKGQTYTFHVMVTNTGQAPQAYFLDPRASSMSTYQLPDQNGSDQNMSLPLPLPSDPTTLPVFPLYVVPADTTQLQTSISGNGPVTYDFSQWTGDPDLSPALSAPTGNTASLNFVPTSGEVTPGLWALFPSEVGPYGPGGAPSLTATATFSAVTPSFDPTVDPSTGDLWSAYAGQSLLGDLNPVYLLPGQSRSIPLTITPTASSGTSVSGTIKVDDIFQANFLDPVFGTNSGFELGGDELASLSYTYTVG